jgi:hypothetical protein
VADFGPFDLLLVFGQEAASETTAENYLKAVALLSYPEEYLKAFALLERPVNLYMRFHLAPQAEAGCYLKAAPLLQRAVDHYIKFELKMPEPTQRYLKSITQMQARGDMYIRCSAQFVIHADYIKVRAALSKQPLVGDIGDGAPPNKVGLLSRHYLSVAAVKKEV